MSGQITAPIVPEHSRVYDLITAALDDPDEPVGLLAYAIYKREKMAEISRLEKLRGRRPTSEELRPFVESAENRIDGFIERAALELADFQNWYIGDHVEGLNRKYERLYTEDIKKLSPPLQQKWYVSVLLSVLGNIFTVLLTFLLFFAVGALLNITPPFKQLLIEVLQKY